MNIKQLLSTTLIDFGTHLGAWGHILVCSSSQPEKLNSSV